MLTYTGSEYYCKEMLTCPSLQQCCRVYYFNLTLLPDYVFQFNSFTAVYSSTRGQARRCPFPGRRSSSPLMAALLCMWPGLSGLPDNASSKQPLCSSEPPVLKLPEWVPWKTLWALNKIRLKSLIPPQICVKTGMVWKFFLKWVVYPPVIWW